MRLSACDVLIYTPPSAEQDQNFDLCKFDLNSYFKHIQGLLYMRALFAVAELLLAYGQMERARGQMGRTRKTV